MKISRNDLSSRQRHFDADVAYFTHTESWTMYYSFNWCSQKYSTAEYAEC